MRVCVGRCTFGCASLFKVPRKNTMADARTRQALEFEARVAQDDRDRKYPNRMWGFYMSNLCLCLWIAAIIALLGVGIGALVYSVMGYDRIGDVKNTVDDMHCPVTMTSFCHTDLATLEMVPRSDENAATHPLVMHEGKTKLRWDAQNITFVGCNAQLVGLVYDTNGVEPSGRRLSVLDTTASRVLGATSRIIRYADNDDAREYLTQKIETSGQHIKHDLSDAYKAGTALVESAASTAYNYGNDHKLGAVGENLLLVGVDAATHSAYGIPATVGLGRSLVNSYATFHHKK